MLLHGREGDKASTGLDAVLKIAFDHYGKEKNQETHPSPSYWQHIICGLTMHGTLSVPWMNETSASLVLNATEASDKEKNKLAIDKLMMLVELTPILLDILAHRAQYIAQLSFVRKEVFDAFHEWLINMGSELYDSLKTERSLWVKIYTLQFGGSDLRLERVRAWSQGFLLMHLLIDVEAEFLNPDETLTDRIKSFTKKLKEALIHHKENRSLPVLSWFMTKQYSGSMDKLNMICSGLENIVSEISCYRASFASSLSEQKVHALKESLNSAIEDKEQAKKVAEEERTQKEEEIRQKEEERTQKEDAQAMVELLQRQMINTALSDRLKAITPSIAQEAFINMINQELDALEKNKFLKGLSREQIAVMMKHCLSELFQSESFGAYQSFMISLDSTTTPESSGSHRNTFFSNRASGSGNRATHAEPVNSQFTQGK